MATDARFSVGLPHHPKTKRLIRRLGHEGSWGLVCLFLWCAANRSDGDLSGMTDEDIELAVDWMGTEGVFVATLREVGFVDGEEGVSSIHDWEEHNPWAAGSEDRSRRARFAVLCRDYGREKAIEMMPEYAKGIIKKPVKDDRPDDQGDINDSKVDDQQDQDGDLLDDHKDDLVDKSRSSPYPYPSPSPSPKDNNLLSTCADRPSDVARKRPDKKPDTAAKIFDYWREVMTSPRSLLDKKRRNVINAALKAGHSQETLQRAILGCSKTPHNMGQNDRGQKYNGIDVIFRSADQIDRFIANADRFEAGGSLDGTDDQYGGLA